MSDFPPYPGTPQYPGGPPMPIGRPLPPAPVRKAVKLMYAGAALSVVSAVIGLLTRHDIRTMVENANPNASLSSINRSVNVVIVAVVIGGAIDAGLWIWMSVANSRGHSWARITGTVFFGICTLSLLLSLTVHTTAGSKVLAVLLWLVGCSTVVLLWRPDSSRFFNRPPNFYYPPGPQNPYYQ